MYAALGESVVVDSNVNLAHAVSQHHFTPIALASLTYGALKLNNLSSSHAVIFDTCRALVRKHSLNFPTSLSSHLPRDPDRG